MITLEHKDLYRLWVLAKAGRACIYNCPELKDFYHKQINEDSKLIEKLEILLKLEITIRVQSTQL